MSGLLLFLRYGEVCLAYRQACNLITPEDAEKVKRHIEEGNSPEPEFVERCFPKAVADYRRYCQEKGYEPDFSEESVKKYWREGHQGETPVMVGIIAGVTKFLILLQTDDFAISVENPRGIEIIRGSRVTCHMRKIIEKL